MAKRGKNSKEHDDFKKQRYVARNYVWLWALDDDVLAEADCRTEPEQVQTFLEQTFGNCIQGAVPSTFGGVVLRNSRAEGAFQQK